jgi:hypothetical protein
MIMRSSSGKRTTAKERELTERVRELEEALAASVPKAKFETVTSSLQLEISDLKTRLSTAEVHAPRTDSPEPRAIGQLNEDGFEEQGGEGLRAEMNQAESSTEDSETENSEEPEADEKTEDTEKPESQVTDQSESAC